jgi:predicted Fe-Mo cluster-binding NifX family protein
MKIAIPTANGKLCIHFGHCETVTIFDVEDGQIRGSEVLGPPPHEPGVLPRWLHALGVETVIAGSMGDRAQAIFAEHGIKVLTGAQAEAPSQTVRRYLDGSLVTGENACDH